MKERTWQSCRRWPTWVTGQPGSGTNHSRIGLSDVQLKIPMQISQEEESRGAAEKRWQAITEWPRFPLVRRSITGTAVSTFHVLSLISKQWLHNRQSFAFRNHSLKLLERKGQPGCCAHREEKQMLTSENCSEEETVLLTFLCVFCNREKKDNTALSLAGNQALVWLFET